MLKQFSIYIVIIASLLVFGSACTTDDESLIVVKLLGKKQNSSTNIVDVVTRNCVSPENKQHICTAGTSNNFSVSFGSEQSLAVGINAVAEGEISLGISEEVAEDLGFNRDSGQTLSFNSPEKGYLTTYRIEEKYIVNTGQAQIKSSTGSDREGNYIYRASCELTIIEEKTVPCPGGNSSGTSTPIPPTPVPPIDTPQPTATSDNSQQEQCQWLQANFPQAADDAIVEFNLPANTTFQFIYELCPSIANAFAFKAKSVVEIQVPSGGCIDSWSGFTEYVGDVGTPVPDGFGGWRVYKGVVRAPEMTVRIIGCQ